MSILRRPAPTLLPPRSGALGETFNEMSTTPLVAPDMRSPHADIAREAGDATADVSAATEQSSAATQQIAAASQELAQMSDSMQALAGAFRV